jgi:hypothetical protein
MKINSSFLFQHPVNVHNYTKNPWSLSVCKQVRFQYQSK